MWKVFCFTKLFINVLLYLFYSFVSIIIGNFLYWAYLTYIKNVWVPGSEDIVHIKLAVFMCFFALFFTLTFRKFFYFWLYKESKWN